MSIVDGKGLVSWEGGLFEPGSDLLRRVQWAFAQIRKDGGTIILNEAGRPFGEPADMNARTADKTVSGISTVWFQWGRYLRGETPSAANPNSGALASEHTQGKAIDCDAPSVFDATLRAKYFGQVGMRQTIASESWHWAIRSNPTVDLTSVSALSVQKLSDASIQEEDMLSFITRDDQSGPWFATNGMVKRYIASKADAQRLVDMGQAKWSGKGSDGKAAEPVPQAFIDSIPTVAQ